MFPYHANAVTCETCANNATCSINSGSYVCQCDEGFTGDGYTSCDGELHKYTKKIDVAFTVFVPHNILSTTVQQCDSDTLSCI